MKDEIRNELGVVTPGRNAVDEALGLGEDPRPPLPTKVVDEAIRKERNPIRDQGPGDDDGA